MLIGQLIQGQPSQLVRGDRNLQINEVVEDSRAATRDCLFVARSGSKADGRRFVTAAVAAGAVAVLTDDASVVPSHVACLVADDVPLAAALIAERFHGDPSRRLRVVGITGTNGKTT